MNKAFADYTTSTAFALTLTKAQCHVLLRIRRSSGVDQYCFHPHQARQLKVKGLVAVLPERELAKQRGKQRFGPIYRLTTAGSLICQLLDEAGITLDTTRTPSLVKAEEFWRFAKEPTA